MTWFLDLAPPWDPLLLSRIQFAFTISFHIIFPALSIGLASFLAVLECLWLYTGLPLYKSLYQFWVKIFAVAFGMGVVSGVVMSYQLGTNWSVLAQQSAPILGPLFTYEVLTAFFLEASFLGIMLFGWDRVSPRMHLVATGMVAIGTLISAWWILAANSWMHTPQGFRIAADGHLHPVDWWAIIWNPSFPYRFVHMVNGAYLATACVVGGVGAFYLYTHKHLLHGQIMLAMATLILAVQAPMQLISGHYHGHNTLIHQPLKVAAMEGNWRHTHSAPLYLFGWPNAKTEHTDYGITIPYGASWILTGDPHGPVPQLTAVPPADRPPVAWVFVAFRIMVGLGLALIGLGITSAVAYWRGQLGTHRRLHQAWMAMAPAGIVAILAGWIVTETGRQPWVAYGILRTSDAVSPVLHGPEVAWSLLMFVITYTVLFGTGAYYIFQLVRKGITGAAAEGSYYQHGLETWIQKSEVPPTDPVRSTPSPQPPGDPHV